MDTVNMYPQPMFCKLFPERGEFDAHASADELLELKQRSVSLLARLATRLKG